MSWEGESSGSLCQPRIVGILSGFTRNTEQGEGVGWGGKGDKSKQLLWYKWRQGNKNLNYLKLLEFSHLKTAKTCTFKTKPVSHFILLIFNPNKNNRPDSPLDHHGFHWCSPVHATRRTRPSLSKIDAVGVGCCSMWFGTEERVVQRKQCKDECGVQ